MARRKRSPGAGNEIRIKGFARVCLRNVRDGREEITPWMPNVITENGFEDYIVGSIGSNLSGKEVAFLQVATQTAAPVSTQQTASGEFENRKSTDNTFSSYGTLVCTASWATNEATQSTLGAVAMYNTSSGGTAAAIATFSTSDKTTDQELKITYQLRFASA